jgi:hypothetical protein
MSDTRRGYKVFGKPGARQSVVGGITIAQKDGWIAGDRLPDGAKAALLCPFLPEITPFRKAAGVAGEAIRTHERQPHSV